MPAAEPALACCPGPAVWRSSAAMGPTLGFWLSFTATLVALAVAVVSGRRGGRRVHLVAGPLAIVLLVVAILCTEELMRSYRFPEAALHFHLWFAKAGGLLALPVVISGLLLVRRPSVRRWHRLAVFAFVVGALLATGTGLWLFGQGTPR